jgi:septum site-determining protein MinC
MNISSSTENIAFQLKGSLLTLTILQLINPHWEAIHKQLEQLVRQTPKLFNSMPIVIDLQKLQNYTDSIDFTSIIDGLRAHKLIPVGIRGGNVQQQEAALAAGLALLPHLKVDLPEMPKPVATTPPSEPVAASDNFTKLITQPVRSGQQIYARQADLIVLAPVSAGAELLADGNIHVYGALRGRALAGVAGNAQARIFCQALEAELVSIAGHYWISEDLQNSPYKENVHIYLEDEKLHIGTL